MAIAITIPPKSKINRFSTVMLDTEVPVSDISKTSTPAEQRVVFYDISWSAND